MRNLVLREHVGIVQVGSYLERYLQGKRTVGSIDGFHIEHTLYAIYLLLNGGGHGLFHVHRIGARKGGRHLDHWGCNIGIL